MAFIDRADIKQYIGPPGVGARYEILAGCLSELRRSQLILNFEDFLPMESLGPLLPQPPPSFALLQGLQVGEAGSQAPRHSMMLHAIVLRCEGLSGRALRKMPFLAHALFVPASASSMPLEKYLDALYRVVQYEGTAREQLEQLTAAA